MVTKNIYKPDTTNNWQISKYIRREDTQTQKLEDVCFWQFRNQELLRRFY
jgi:hypothetical protein